MEECNKYRTSKNNNGRGLKSRAFFVHRLILDILGRTSPVAWKSLRYIDLPAVKYTMILWMGTRDETCSKPSGPGSFFNGI
jgi:hypothetical protein